MTKTANILCAVSGGKDSLVMLYYLVKEGYTVSVAHVNFQLRGEESDRDERYVRKVAAGLGVPIFVKHFQTKEIALERKKGIQEVARDLRYAWFEELAEQHGFDYIAVAHHAEDLAETMLFNFVRGTGIRGLGSIKALNGKIWRPILEWSKSNITEFSASNQISWMEDSSNQTDAYSRNFLRRQVVPLLKKVNPTFVQSSLEMAKRFQEIELLFLERAEQLKAEWTEQEGGRFKIKIAPLKEAPYAATLLYEWLKSFGFSSTQSQEVFQLLNAQPGVSVSSSTHKCTRDRAFFIVEKTEELLVANEILIGPEDTEVVFPGGKLVLTYLPPDKHADHIFTNNHIFLNVQSLQFPLVLRPWRQGDRFRPRGRMSISQKVSDFLINAKVPLPDKAKVYVLCSGGEICYLVGMRVDERFVGWKGAVLSVELS